MATLTVDQTRDFTGESSVDLIDTINFTNTKFNGHPVAIATFTASQFDNINFSQTMNFGASIGVNAVVINDAHDFGAGGGPSAAGP